ncbi:TRAP transporter large permease subunit [Rhizobium sp. SSA_523]|uniref:TRAP transporter large permease n=1 Tax=Rhizobium sp. SSA_523 TaxID=2952477 RepID=UPI0020913840|nr:TRAP transporter large permease subunit [Rhizobium sp. SSA_523]MCO5731425.1 TRAP transporter large permease subunit [Rhizobium sp. SSA_523]WKC22052.1 TRAP transporter large permease subunit [Rhizobium sp. SSA_523]
MVDGVTKALLAALETVLETCAAGLLLALLVLVLSNVTLRYGFQTGFIGAEELGIWLHLALISLAAPLALRGPLAMRFELAVRALPPRLTAVTDVLADMVSVLTGLTLLFGSLAVIGRSTNMSAALGLPEWLRFAAIAAGGGLLLLVLILQRLTEGRGRGLLASLVLGCLAYGAITRIDLAGALPPSAALAVFAGLGLLVGAPLAHAFLAAASLAGMFGSSLPEPALVSTAVNGMSRFLLLAIPFFLLVGGLLTLSGAAERLVGFAASLVGHRRAGLAQTVLLTSVIFSGASGSSVANAAFGATTFQPQLVKNGYPPAQAGAIIAATSVLDNVIPPSIAFLLLAAATNLSVGSLLTGGFLAGGLMATCLCVAIHLSAGASAQGQPASTGARLAALGSALPAFGLGVIVVVGIRFGAVTPTEAAALAAFYTLVLAGLARPGLRALVMAFRRSALEAGAIGLLIGSAGPFAFLLAVDDVGQLLSSAIHSFGGSAWTVLLGLNLVLLVAGLVLDIGAAILLLGPILLPVAVAAGIDPIHFGVILVVNLMIHGLTPPLGMLVYVVSGVTHVPAAALFRAVLPYLAALLVALLILCIATLVL